MSMRDLACCAGGMAFYSTPSDLVRFALGTNADSVNGELAGGRVMSLMTGRDNGIVVAVASNVAHANTAALALKVAEVFAEQTNRSRMLRSTPAATMAFDFEKHSRRMRKVDYRRIGPAVTELASESNSARKCSSDSLNRP